MVEATLDDPRQVLLAQQFKARGEAVAEMKAEGIEYDERMELLDDVSWPKPLQELLEAVFETYRQGHPWVAETPLSPKSVVRDLWERAMTFGEFVSYYGLARSEGLLAGRTGRLVRRANVYMTLQRLEDKGFLTTALGDARPERGGKPRRLVTPTRDGVAAVRATMTAIQAMTRGVKI